MFTHCMADILEANRYAREQRIPSWVMFFFGVVNTILGIATLLTRTPRGIGIICFGALFLLIGLFATRMAGIGTWYLKATTVPFVLLIDDAGITFLDEIPNLVTWQTFSRWFEVPNVIGIVAKGIDCLVIPKRCMTSEQMEELRKLLRRELGDDARW